MARTTFERDAEKDLINQDRHGVPFSLAQFAFADLNRVIARDLNHSDEENRYFCFGKTEDEILTVRFAYRGERIRIFGVGYWRRREKIYEQENHLFK